MTQGIIIKNQNIETQITDKTRIWVSDEVVNNIDFTMPSDGYAQDEIFYWQKPLSHHSDIINNRMNHGGGGGGEGIRWIAPIRLSSTQWYRTILAMTQWYPSMPGDEDYFHIVGLIGEAGAVLNIPYIVCHCSGLHDVSGGVFNIYNEAEPGTGDMVFNSEVQAVKFLTYEVFDNPMVGNPPYTDYDITVSDADNNFFMLCGFGWGYHQNGDPDYRRWYNIVMKKIDSTTVRVSARNTHSFYNDQGGSNTHHVEASPKLTFMELGI